MEAEFYDVKSKEKVIAKVTSREKYEKNGHTRYALKAKTKDGRNLTKFCSEADYNKAGK